MILLIKKPKTGQLIVRFSIVFLTGQIAKTLDCPVKNRTPGNPIVMMSPALENSLLLTTNG